jgi:hypothetical protein
MSLHILLEKCIAGTSSSFGVVCGRRGLFFVI